jgi:fatty acid desaturase
MELALMLVNYAFLLWLGPVIAISSILLSGLLVALIVTATHQSEEIIMPIEVQQDGKTPVLPLKEYSFVECQFATTRDVQTDNPFVSWLWGGMQYQLEHHLWPTMPKYYYSRLVPRVKEFAAANGLEYKCDTVGQIMKRNYATLKHFAQELKDECTPAALSNDHVIKPSAESL